MRVAIVQLCSTDDLKANLLNAERGVQEAAQRGASFVALPENFAYMRREGARFPFAENPATETEAVDRPPTVDSSSVDGEGESEAGIERALSRWARTHGVWLLGGTFPEAIPGDERVYNTSVLLSPDGREVARYRKIHLFDVALGPDGSDEYRESTHFAPGDRVVVGQTPFGGVGMSVCYDLRFPELYRALVGRGARWIVVPSAFARETGRDHWEVLLRARAIESQAFVVAPAQCGHHSSDRASHGRSLIIDPWGLVIAAAGDEPCVLVAECPEEAIGRVRNAIPALSHRRLP